MQHMLWGSLRHTLEHLLALSSHFLRAVARTLDHRRTFCELWLALSASCELARSPPFSARIGAMAKFRPVEVIAGAMVLEGGVPAPDTSLGHPRPDLHPSAPFCEDQLILEGFSQVHRNQRGWRCQHILGPHAPAAQQSHR